MGWFRSALDYLKETTITVAVAVLNFKISIVEAIVEAVVEVAKIIACLFFGCVKLTRK